MTAPEPPPPVPAFGMTDLEEELRGPGAQAVRSALVARLGALQERIQEEMKTGMAPEDFARAKAIATALAAAKEVVLIVPEGI